jgi:hypothetical protein
VQRLNKCSNKQHIDIQPLDNDFLEKTLSREKPHIVKHTQCIIQQLNSYNTLESLCALNRSVQRLHKDSVEIPTT